MKNSTFWIVAAGIAIFAWFKYRMATMLEFTLGGISFAGGTLLNPVVLIDININNPTSTTATINAINVQLISNGSNIGSVNQTYEQVISGNTQSVLQLPINVQVVGLLADIVQTIKMKGTVLQLIGTVTVDLIPVPINITYNF